MLILAFHRHGLGELRSEVRARPKLTEEGLRQGLGIGRGLGIGLFDLGSAAFGVGAHQFGGPVGGKTESDKERRVVDVDIDRFAGRIDRRLERQR